MVYKIKKTAIINLVIAVWNSSGEYGIRTRDLLTASQTR